MLEVATSEAHREALARAHAERAKVMNEIFVWIGSFFSSRKSAPVASAA
ncbi:MAG: hypothetical protein AAF714_11160 [Pseudomonadota bacterium]